MPKAPYRGVPGDALVSQLVLALITFLLPLQSAAPQPKPANPAEPFIQLVNQRREAEARGDVAAWNRLVAPDCIWVEPNGRKESVAFHVPRPKANVSAVKTEVKRSDFELHQHGETAVVTYQEDVSSTVADSKVRSVIRFTEVFHRAADGWVLVHSTETPIVERAGIKLDPELFQDYLGDYEVAPGLIGTVYRDGDKLMLTSKSWRRAYELVPVSTTTFFVREFENTDIEFVRDASGKVTHHISRSPSQDPLIAKKIR